MRSNVITEQTIDGRVHLTPVYSSLLPLPEDNSRKATADRLVFAHNMKWLIHNSKLSVDQLCKDLNLSKHRVNRWLTGVCYPTNEVMVQLCHYFGYYDIFALLTRRECR